MRIPPPLAKQVNQPPLPSGVSGHMVAADDAGAVQAEVKYPGDHDAGRG